MKKRRIAYSYLRFSSGEQAKGDSANRQRKAFIAFCQRHGLTPAENYEYFDKGLSGYHKKNLRKGSQLMKLLGELKRKAPRGEVPQDAVLVVEAWDRLTALASLTQWRSPSKSLIRALRLAFVIPIAFLTRRPKKIRRSAGNWPTQSLRRISTRKLFRADLKTLGIHGKTP